MKKKNTSLFSSSSTKKAIKQRNKHKAKDRNRSVSGISITSSSSDFGSDICSGSGSGSGIGIEVEDVSNNHHADCSKPRSSTHDLMHQNDDGDDLGTKQQQQKQQNRSFRETKLEDLTTKLEDLTTQQKILSPTPYRRLNFKQHVDMDQLKRQRSLSPCEPVPPAENNNQRQQPQQQQNQIAGENLLSNLLSPNVASVENFGSFDDDKTNNSNTVNRSPKRAATATAEQQDLVRASGKNPTATLELDLEGNIKHLSKSWEFFVGTSVRKIVKKPISKIIIGDQDDKAVFQRATEIMTSDDASYSVRFIVARNNIKFDHDEFTDDYDGDGDRDGEGDDMSNSSGSTNTVDGASAKSGSSTSQEDLDLDNDSANDITINEHDDDNYREHQSPSHSVNSKSSSELSTNDELIELEGQGILIHDINTNEPTHSMWLIRPYVEYEFLIEAPGRLAEILGFGAELFVHYLKAISDAGISNEQYVPPPQQLFCNICEQQVPNWWLERHSEICYFESKAESDLQIAHDNLVEHRNLINSIATLKTAEYKGLKLPISVENQSHHKSLLMIMPNRNLPNGLRFPFRTLHSLNELCTLSINVDPVDFESDEEKDQKSDTDDAHYDYSNSNDALDIDGSSGNRPITNNYKQSIEKEFSEIFEWRIPKSNDKAINILIEDTEALAKDKAEAVLRVVNTQRFHNQLKKEVDSLVLGAVHETVNKVSEHLNGVNRVSSPIISAAVGASPDLIYNYLDREGTPHSGDSNSIHNNNNNRNSTPISGAASGMLPSVPSPLRRSNSGLAMQRQGSSSSIVSDRKSCFGGNDSSQLSDSFRDFSLLDTAKNNSSSSLKKTKDTKNSTAGSTVTNSTTTTGGSAMPPPSLNSTLSPRRSYSPNAGMNSPLTSIQRNNKSQNNLYLNNNDSSVSSKPNTATSSPLLVGGDSNYSNVFLDYSAPSRKDFDDSGQPMHSTPSNLLLSQPTTSISKPPLSPLLISSFTSNKPAQPSIKDYEIIKPISKGAFGSVYLAKKKINGEYYAIKVLKKSDMVAKNQVTNVKAERAIMMSQSDSPFVAKLFCTFQTRNYLFLVMEYLIGGDCASLLKMLGALPEEWTKRYVAEIVVGVDALHCKGIVHRDLKPDNFLIDARGHLKLTDFGLSRMGLVGRQYRHQKKIPTVNTPDTDTFPFFSGSNTKKNSPIIPIINDHKRSISYASSISSSDSSNNLFVGSHGNSSTSIANYYNNSNNNNNELKSMASGATAGGSGVLNSSNNFNSPTTAWFENLMKQERSNSGLTGGSPRTNSLAGSIGGVQGGGQASGQGGSQGGGSNNNLSSNATATANPSDQTASPVVKPLHKSNSQTSFAFLDDDVLPNHASPQSLALFNPQSSTEARNFVGTPDYLAPETIKGAGQDESSDWWSLGCILFEFLFGYPPFHAHNVAKVFENILVGQIDWPELDPEELLLICSDEAKDLIEKLLNVDPRQRLGNNGATEIKNHDFFKGIDWDKLWDEEASFIPSVDDPASTDYFDSRGAKMDEALYEKDAEITADIVNDEHLREIFNANEDDNSPGYDAASASVTSATALTPGGGVDRWLSKFDEASSQGESGSETNTNTPTATSASTPSNNSDGQYLQSPSVVRKERRKSTRLVELNSSSEFGSFQYRNLTALEKANKDVINRLKSEHKDHRHHHHKSSMSSSSSSSLIDSGSRSRGLSFNSSYGTPPFISKPPPTSASASASASVSASVSTSVSASANVTSSNNSIGSGSPNRSGVQASSSTNHPHSFSPHIPSPSLRYEHSSHSIGVTPSGDDLNTSKSSLGRASPISTLHNSDNGPMAKLGDATTSNNNNESGEFMLPLADSKTVAKISPAQFGQEQQQHQHQYCVSFKNYNKGMLYGKNIVDFSPSSSDNEDSKNSAILRIRRRRSRRVGSGASSISMGKASINSSSGSGTLMTAGTKVPTSTTNNSELQLQSQLAQMKKFKSIDILVCEQIPIFRYSIKKLLEQLGCNVVAVGSGDEMIRRASGHVKFDLILTTIKVQKLHTIDIIKLIRYTNTINSQTPIVALTSFYKEAMSTKLFDDVIEKPATETKMQQVLKKFCSSRGDALSDTESIVSVRKPLE